MVGFVLSRQLLDPNPHSPLAEASVHEGVYVDSRQQLDIRKIPNRRVASSAPVPDA